MLSDRVARANTGSRTAGNLDAQLTQPVRQSCCAFASLWYTERSMIASGRPVVHAPLLTQRRFRLPEPPPNTSRPPPPIVTNPLLGNALALVSAKRAVANRRAAAVAARAAEDQFPSAAGIQRDGRHTPRAVRRAKHKIADGTRSVSATSHPVNVYARGAARETPLAQPSLALRAGIGRHKRGFRRSLVGRDRRLAVGSPARRPRNAVAEEESGRVAPADSTWSAG